MVKTIRGRIAFTYYLLIIIAVFAAGIIGLQAIRNSYQSTRLNSLEQLAEGYGALAIPMLDPNSPADLKKSTAQNLTRISANLKSDLWIIGKDGTVYFTNVTGDESQLNSFRDSFLKDPTLSDALSGRVISQIRDGVESNQNQLVTTVPIINHGSIIGACLIVDSAAPVQGYLRGAWVQLGVFLLVLFVIAGALGLYIIRRVSGPIVDITRSAQRILAGQLQERIPYQGMDELGEMSETMNSLATRLSDQIDTLTQEKSKLYAILAQMQSGVIVVDRASKINLLNHSAERLLGIHEKELLGKWHWEALRSYGLSSLIDQAVLKGVSVRKELTLTAAPYTIIEVFVSPITGNSGSPAGAVMVLHDISEFKRLEQMRSEFVANVSHELRTPITSIRGFAETLLDGALSDPKAATDFLEIIYQESERIARIVHDLLELSKIEHNHSSWRFEKDIDIKEIISSVVHSMNHSAEEAGVKLQLDRSVQEAEIPLAEMDRDRIAQVLVNLVANAIHYTPSPGSITVGCEDVGSGIRVWVKDTGIGIPQEDQKRLFERFYRVDKARERRSGGTGLGLSIVKHIVEAHHGYCEVQSKIGEGSCFSFVIPYRQEI